MSVHLIWNVAGSSALQVVDVVFTWEGHWMTHCFWMVPACAPSPPLDNIWAMMILWRIRGKIITNVLCCVVYNSCAQRYTYTYEQFLKLTVGVGFGLDYP